MAEESRRRARNALVGSGATLLFYALAGIVYAEALRSDATPCGDGGQALLVGACYRVWLLLLPVLVAGLGLLLGGLLGARAPRQVPADELTLSSGAHATTWLLTSLVALPLLALAIQSYRERLLDTVFTITLYDVPFKHTFLLTLWLLVALAAWGPYITMLVVHHVRWRIFLARYEAHAEDA